MIFFITKVVPFATPINSTFYGLLFLTIVAAILAYLLLTNKMLLKLQSRGLLGMLCGFVCIVCLGAIIFSFIHSRSIQPLEFSKEALTIGAKKIDYKNISSHYIKPLIQQSRYSAQISVDTALVYVIELRDGKTILLSNDNYNMLDVKAAMKTYVNN